MFMKSMPKNKIFQISGKTKKTLRNVKEANLC